MLVFEDMEKLDFILVRRTKTSKVKLDDLNKDSFYLGVYDMRWAKIYYNHRHNEWFAQLGYEENGEPIMIEALDDATLDRIRVLEQVIPK